MIFSDTEIIIFPIINCEIAPKKVSMENTINIEKKSMAIFPIPELGIDLSKNSKSGINTNCDAGAPILRIKNKIKNKVTIIGSVMNKPEKK